MRRMRRWVGAFQWARKDRDSVCIGSIYEKDGRRPKWLAKVLTKTKRKWSSSNLRRLLVTKGGGHICEFTLLFLISWQNSFLKDFKLRHKNKRQSRIRAKKQIDFCFPFHNDTIKERERFRLAQFDHSQFNRGRKSQTLKYSSESPPVDRLLKSISFIHFNSNLIQLII